jgi:hypothetical protein
LALNKVRDVAQGIRGFVVGMQFRSGDVDVGDFICIEPVVVVFVAISWQRRNWGAMSIGGGVRREWEEVDEEGWWMVLTRRFVVVLGLDKWICQRARIL